MLTPFRPTVLAPLIFVVTFACTGDGILDPDDTGANSDTSDTDTSDTDTSDTSADTDTSDTGLDTENCVSKSTVSVVVAGDPGAVTAAGLTCTDGTCTGDYCPGTPLTLTATPDDPACFDGWSGGHTSGEPVSTLVVSADASVTATFGPCNTAFVTSTRYEASTLGGQDQADAACAARATAAGLEGTYVAWLWTTAEDPIDKLGTARGWRRVDEKPFADSVTDLVIYGRVHYPLDIDEFGNRVSGDAIVGDAGFSCSDWTSTEGWFQGGSVGAGSGAWLAAFSSPCSQGAGGRLYCLGTDRSAAVLVTPETGRFAFVSEGTFVPVEGGDITDADDLCADEAAAAQLPGTYKALLSTTTAAAAERFQIDLDTEPWVRTDGVPVVDHAMDLFASDFVAPLNVDAGGTHYYGPNDRVWSGSHAPNVTGSGSQNCNDWSTPSLDVTGTHGAPPYANYEFFDFMTWQCSYGLRLYCLQE